MPRAPKIEDTLRSIPLFQNLTRAELKRVAKDFDERFYSAGEDIVTEGEKGGGFFVVAEGRVKIIQGGRTRSTAGRGFSFGEMTLLDGQPRSATIQADTQVRALATSSWTFLSLLEENWAITRKVLAHLSSRVRAAEKSAAH